MIGDLFRLIRNTLILFLFFAAIFGCAVLLSGQL